MFKMLDAVVKTFKSEQQHIKIVFVTIEKHLAILIQNFRKSIFCATTLDSKIRVR